MKSNLAEKERKDASTVTISYLERRWLLLLLDFLAINSGFVLSLYFRDDYLLSWSLLSQNPEWFVLLNGLWFFLGHLLQVYDLEKAGETQPAFVSVLSTGLISIIIFNLIPYLPPTLPPSRQPLFLTILLPLFFLILGRSLYLLIFAQSRFRRRLIILGAGWAGRTIYRALHEHAQTLYEVVGFIDDDLQKIGTSVEIHHNDSGQSLEQLVAAEVKGKSGDLLDLIADYKVTTVVLAITRNVGGELYQVLNDCLQREIAVIPMPLLYEQLTGKVPVEHIGDHWSVAMPLEQPGTRLIWHAGKRTFDILWSSLGLLFLALLFPFIAMAIKLDSPGPILYTQKRLGRYGKQIRVYKFRSMVEDAEKDQAVWAKINDTRVTRVGRVLRRTHIDEFPQFWNIFKGEMSVVGPRPERPEFINELAEKIPFYRVRLAAKPGMAGWALIHQGYGASKDDALKKLQYDLYYIKHQSFWLDVFVLWRTFIDALTFRGR